MTKQELFKKYSIDESHGTWSPMIDNWMSVEVYRVMHGGELPNHTDMSAKYITEFYDKFHADEKFQAEIMKRNDWGSLYLTTKRMIYRYADIILKELN